MSINTISKYGDQQMMKLVAERAISGEFYDDILTQNHSFVSFFRDNDNLTSVNMPKTTTVTAAQGCDSLEEVFFPLVTEIPQFMFANCPKVKKITGENFPKARVTRGEIATNCSSLVNVELPSIADGIYPFNGTYQNCTSLRRVYYQSLNLNNSGYSLYRPSNNNTGVTFRNCTALEIFRTPSQAYAVCDGAMFDASTVFANLKLIDFGLTTKVGSYANYGFRYTKILILRKTDAIATLASVANITADTTPTPIKVYVPSALISSYESGTNWSTLLANGYVEFRALEGSRFEQPDFDDTDIYNADRDELDELL